MASACSIEVDTQPGEIPPTLIAIADEVIE
jgi:hypothetical protein